jgi:hypothetical protein
LPINGIFPIEFWGKDRWEWSICLTGHEKIKADFDKETDQHK